MNADRAEAAFWAGFLRNRNVEAATADDAAIPVAGGYAISVPGTVYQLALAVGSSRPLTEDDLRIVDAFYRAREALPRIELREEALARDRTVLADGGYDAEELAITLLEAPAARFPDDPAIRVRATTDRAGWVALASAGFAGDGDPAPHVRTAQVGAAAASGLFVAEIDGTPAGAGAAGIAGDVAFLYSGTVLPAFRGRGVHGALLRARLSYAVSRGATRGALKALAGSSSERSAKRAGFVPTATLRRARRS